MLSFLLDRSEFRGVKMFRLVLETYVLIEAPIENKALNL